MGRLSILRESAMIRLDKDEVDVVVDRIQKRATAS
jgi:hypothetical protein